MKRPSRILWIFIVCFTVLMWGGFASAQEKEQPAEKEQKPKIKEYSEVITDEAISDVGVFTTHMVGEKLYFEIPESELDRLFLWVTQFDKIQTGKGFGGFAYNNQVVNWERRGDRIFLRQIQHSVVADEESNVSYAVDKSTYPAILMAFDIEAFGDNNSIVINVTPLFTADMLEFAPKKQFKARRLDPKRSFVDRVASYPENIETVAVLTFEVEPEEPTRFSRTSPGSTISAAMHHSMVHLPEKPMMPRLYDERAGFFTIEQTDYGIDSHQAETRRYITRFRLEKKNPNAAISEPVKPIVFYIDRSVPEKWRPYFKIAVEDWQPAFEKAGFRNAIIAKDAPSVEEDPEWSSEDARYSSICWVPATIENAFGPHISDPRTGEILDADVKIYHNVVKLAWCWYFVQCAAVDERAQKIPMPDDLIGDMLRFIVAHEVGHSIGLPHNFKASSAYTVENLRDAEFTAEYGDATTIMDYARFNYVAQPGDNARLIPLIGPYDHHIIEWGYKPISGARTPDEEKPELNKIVRRADTNPFLQFGPGSRFDPSAQTEDIGSDPIEATRYGLMNIKRIVPMLIPATYKEGEDYSELNNLYGRLIGQMNRELGHVTTMIGGVVETRNWFGQEGGVFKAVSRERQKAAIKFLHDNAFATPEFLLDTEILDLIEPSGNIDRITQGQARILNRILDEACVKRLIDQEATAKGGERPYTLAEMLEDLRAGIWSELEAGSVTIDPYRRNLQRSYVEIMSSKLSGENASKSDMRALARGELKDVSNLIEQRLDRASDRITRLHLEDIHASIELALKPSKNE